MSNVSNYSKQLPVTKHINSFKILLLKYTEVSNEKCIPFQKYLMKKADDFRQFFFIFFSTL